MISFHRIPQDLYDKRFSTVPEYPSPAEPPRYSSAETEVKLALLLRTCPFCATQHLPAEYKKHLVIEHAHLLFHCEECSSYIDRKDFIVHMSQHAADYTDSSDGSDGIKREPQEPRRRKTRKRREESDLEENPTKSEPAQPATDEPAPKQELDNSKEKQTNEFSDHSDTEYGFGPLPESVFEAIEDSQDSQPAEEEAPHSPEQRISDVAHSSAPETPSEHAEDGRDVNDAHAPEANAKPEPHKKTRTCPICSKEYRASSSYFYHMKHAHQRSREHECEVCGRGFGTRGALAQHAPLHTGESRFECALCHKRFRSNAGLYIHAQTHGAHKAWACSTCGRAFRWRAQLRRHAARHVPARPHACSSCGRAFRARCDLLRHARTHARGAHACDTCGLEFAQLRYLKVHIDKQH